MAIEAPSAAEFCSIIGASKLAGFWSGSAFRDHPRGIIRERMIFTNKWNVHNYCDVKVITDPDAKVIMGCQQSAAHGNPYPSVDRGELVTVYKDGRWVAEGPWCERIVAILDEAKAEIAEIKAQEQAEYQRKQEAAKAEAARKLDLARAAFQ